MTKREGRWRRFRPDGKWTHELPSAPGYYFRRFVRGQIRNVVFFEVVLVDQKLCVKERWRARQIDELLGYEFCQAIPPRPRPPA